METGSNIYAAVEITVVKGGMKITATGRRTRSPNTSRVFIYGRDDFGNYTSARKLDRRLRNQITHIVFSLMSSEDSPIGAVPPSGGAPVSLQTTRTQGGSSTKPTICGHPMCLPHDCDMLCISNNCVRPVEAVHA